MSVATSYENRDYGIVYLFKATECVGVAAIDATAELAKYLNN